MGDSSGAMSNSVDSPTTVKRLPALPSWTLGSSTAGSHGEHSARRRGAIGRSGGAAPPPRAANSHEELLLRVRALLDLGEPRFAALRLYDALTSVSSKPRSELHCARVHRLTDEVLVALSESDPVFQRIELTRALVAWTRRRPPVRTGQTVIAMNPLLMNPTASGELGPRGTAPSPPVDGEPEAVCEPETVVFAYR